MRSIPIVLLVTVFTSSTLAQLPATPDASRYPQLAAMKRWLESGADQSRHCALSAGLFAEASDIFRLVRSEPRTLDMMTKRHTENLGAADRAKLRNTLEHVTGMAAGLADLAAETAPIAATTSVASVATKPGRIMMVVLNSSITSGSHAAKRARHTGMPRQAPLPP